MHSPLFWVNSYPPGLILEHNLHGIELDRRAAQIASFALWLRAQRAYDELGVPKGARPPLTQIHVVVAKPMPAEEDLLEEFVGYLKPPPLRDLVRTIFDGMRPAGKVGSLLAIEESVRDAFWSARSELSERPRKEQLALYPRDCRRTAKLDLYALSDEAFFAGIEHRVGNTLAAYAARTSGADKTRRRLFAEDAAQGFSFVELAMRNYDVVLVHPPTGAPAGREAQTYVSRTYPRSPGDLDTAFVDRWSRKLVDGGKAGAITTRKAFFLSSFEAWREQVALSGTRLIALADLGNGMLDSAAYVLERGAPAGNAIFVRLTKEGPKGPALEGAVDAFGSGKIHALIHVVNPDRFRKDPGAPFVYWSTC